MVENKNTFVSYVTPVVVAIMLTACSGPVSMNDLPAYPGAVEHKAGQSQIGNTLAKNAQTDAAMRSAVGVGGKTEQKGYRLPKDAKWEDVKRFYDDKLGAAGWSSGAGGVMGGMVSDVLNAANQSNNLSQTTLYSRGKQTLTVIVVTNPTKKGERDLLLSLSTN